MITVKQIHLMSYVGKLEFIRHSYKTWRKKHYASFAFTT